MIEPRHIAVVLFCGLAGACAGQSEGMVAVADYRARHPVELAQDVTQLEVFAGRGLDARARAQVAEFAAAYHRIGTGPITILLPAGSVRQNDYRRQFDDIRQALVQAGLRGSVKAGTYDVIDPSLAAPVRLSFIGFKARVPGACGQWPDDLASGSSAEGWTNANYANFGCAYQSMLAAQTADPRDVAGRRAASAPDAEQRLRAIGALRRGNDPSTQWQTR